MSLVSVVIPTYNHGHFVTEAVESALAQTYHPIEVIVVDDGSSDDTREILRCYGDRIRYVFQENKGLSAARNTGIRVARGEWIALLDSDDIWAAEKLETQLRCLDKHPSAGLVGALNKSDASFGPPPVPLGCVTVRVLDFLTSTPFGPSSALIRRDVLEEVGGFDETLRSVEDRDMWLRIAVRYPALRVEWPCWYYRVSAGQMSRNAPRMYAAFRQVLEKFFRQHPGHASSSRLAYAFMYRDASWTYFEQGNRLRACALLALSAIKHPGGIANQRVLDRTKLAWRYLFGVAA